MKQSPLIAQTITEARPQRNLHLIPQSEYQGEPYLPHAQTTFQDAERDYRAEDAELLKEQWSDAARAAAAAARKGRGKGLSARKTLARSVFKRKAGVASNFEPGILRGVHHAHKLDTLAGGTISSGEREGIALKRAKKTISRQKARFGSKFNSRDQRRLSHYLGQYI